MNILLIVWEAVCLAGVVLAVRSFVAVGAPSPLTYAGWLFTAGYFIIAAYDAFVRRVAPFHIDYVLVVALTVAFIFAGIRKEPQAEPWWWPQRSER